MWTTMILALAPFAAQEPVEAILAPTRAALVVEPDAEGEIRLSRLLKAFEAASDWTIEADDETRALLEESVVCTFSTLRAEPEAVTRTVELALASSLYHWTVVRAQPPRLLRVESSVMDAGKAARANAAFVPVERIARFAEHPGVYVETLVQVESLAGRWLLGSIRYSLVESAGMQVTAMGDEGGLLIAGTGARVANLVAALNAANKLAAGEELAHAAPAELAPRVADAGAEPLSIAADDDGEPTLLDLTRTFAEQTGRSALLYRDSLRELGSCPVGLMAPMKIASADFPTWYEQLLVERGFVMVRFDAGSGAPFSIRTLDLSVRMDGVPYRFVEPDALAGISTLPATGFVTVLSVPHLDGVKLLNTVRGMIVDSRTLNFASVGEARILIVRGLGARLARFVRVLQAAENAAAALPEDLEGDSGPESGK